MSHVLILIHFLCFGVEAVQRLEIDEHSVDMVLSVAGNEKVCIIVYDEIAEPLPKTRYYLFDLAKESGVLLNDGRIKGTRILSHPKGFILTDIAVFSTPKCFLMSKDGAFIDTIEIEDSLGWPTNISLSSQYSRLNGEMLIGFERPSFDNPKTDQIFLGSLDLKENRFEELFVYRKQPDHLTIWLPVGRNFALLDLNTGSVDLFSETTFTHRTLLKAMEVRDSPAIAQLKKLGKKVEVPAWMRLYAYTHNAFALGKTISLHRTIFPDDDSPLDQGIIIDENGHITYEKNRILIWTTDKKSIFLDLKEQTFFLTRH